MSDMAMIRIGILIAGLLLVAAIFLFGRPKKSPQGRRVDKDDTQPRERREPVISSGVDADGMPFERSDTGAGKVRKKAIAGVCISRMLAMSKLPGLRMLAMLKIGPRSGCPSTKR